MCITNVSKKSFGDVLERRRVGVEKGWLDVRR